MPVYGLKEEKLAQPNMTSEMQYTQDYGIYARVAAGRRFYD
jgi:hypothetical protein